LLVPAWIAAELERWERMQYQTPVVQDFGSIAAHTFTRIQIGDPVKGPGPGHLDFNDECSGGSDFDPNYPVPC
jgi:hypothetical protein